MTLNEIRGIRDATPFRPFVMILHDARHLLIQGQPYLGITPKGVLLAVSPDRTVLLAPEQVKELRTIAMAREAS